MTASNVNLKQLTSVGIDGSLPVRDVGKASVDEKLAAAAFQKIYQLMLEKNMSSSAFDISESSDSVQNSGSFASSDSTQIWNQLLLTQQMLMASGAEETSNANGSDLEGKLNLVSRFSFNSTKQISASGTNSSDDYENLGVLSSKFESNGNPGVISNNAGDPGGKSYGAWQFSSRMGSLDSFLGWLKGSSVKYYNDLKAAKDADGGAFRTNFDNTWTRIARNDRTEFLKLQQQYVKESYYDSAVEELKSKYGFDVNSKSNAMKNVLWSTVVQHGVRGALNIFSKIDLKNDEQQVISGIYNERQKVDLYFNSSSSSIKRSVFNRFTREKSEALAMLGSE